MPGDGDVIVVVNIGIVLEQETTAGSRRHTNDLDTQLYGKEECDRERGMSRMLSQVAPQSVHSECLAA